VSPTPPPAPTPLPPPNAKNVLLLIVDDLRPQLNVTYGNEEMLTPNMDRLAGAGIAFHRAYVQISVCAPSRNSFMTGRRPDKTMCWNFKNDFRSEGKDGRPATGSNW
jgi:arylsulfatase A-like enzyme